MTHGIVLLRGLGRDSRHWGKFKDEIELATGMPAVGIDLPGTGTRKNETCPTSIAKIAEKVASHSSWGAGKVHLIGMSLGGMVAAELASRSPQVASLSVINTSAKNASPWKRFSPKLLASSVSAFVARKFEGEEVDYAVEYAIHKATCQNSSFLAQDLAQWVTWRKEAKMSSSGVARQLVAAAHHRPGKLPESVRATVLASRGDRLVDWQCSRRLADEWSAEFILHEWAGHDLPRDDLVWTIGVCAKNIKESIGLAN